MEDSTALECNSLTRRFGKLIADDALSFKVKKQEIFGLLGPNGAGKSTLIKMLTTILPPTSGDALVAGVSICKAPDQVREVIGYVPQMISTDGSLTGYENLLMAAKLYHIPSKDQKQLVQQALESMGLTEVADRYVREYSGGMIRRLEIIQAMLHKPKILFLDEPTSGLDPMARKTVWTHLKQLHKQENITIILTTHDMLEAEYLCDRIAIMVHGKIIVMGNTAELKATVGENATLDDVFIHYVGDSLEVSNAFNEHLIRRRTENKRGS